MYSKANGIYELNHSLMFGAIILDICSFFEKLNTGPFQL